VVSRTSLAIVLLACASCSGASERKGPVPDAVLVAPGESIQAAIDRAPSGGVVRLGAGEWNERVVIEKPLTLEGAGWEKTRIRVEEVPLPQLSEALLAESRKDAKTSEERRRFADEWVRRAVQPAIWVHDASDVSVRDLRVQGSSDQGPDGGIGNQALIYFQRSSGKLSGCAIVGPYGQGVQVAEASDAEITGCLVAAIWGTGVRVDGKDPERDAGPSRLRLLGSEVRNCHHRGVVIGTTDALVERCRISGSAWHGIRYDHAGPTIRDNVIFGNARSGIYASGRTTAIVRGNLFWKNEMDGISCWFDNADVIEGNTFVDNLREGMLATAGARPTVAKNVFAGNPVAIDCTGADRDRRPGKPHLGENLYWENPIVFRVSGEVQPTPESSTLADPQFRSREKLDFALVPGGPARSAGIGAADPVAPTAQWPIQEEERSIVPTTETRDSRQWRAAVADEATKRGSGR
jgi:nitrous oxidase accessory protein